MGKEEKEKQIEQVIKENMQKVKLAGMLDGARGIAGTVLKMCNKKQNPALTVNEIKRFCERSLSLKGQQEQVEEQ